MRLLTTIAALSLISLSACATPEPVKSSDAASDTAPAKKVVVAGSRIPQDASIKQIGVTDGLYNGAAPH